MANVIQVEIDLDTGELRKDLGDVEKKSKKSGEKIGSNILASFTKLRAGIAVIGTAIVGAIGGTKALQAAALQEDAINALNTSLKTAGTFSEEASQSFQKLAASLEANSVIGDEVILQQAALARNFTKSNEEAEKLTKAAVELSAATDMTLDSAVKNLGKTFAGLTGELGESIPALRNLSAEALKSGAALDFVLSRFKGSSLAQTRTFSGAIKQLGNSFGTLLESIGKFGTGSPVLIKTINTLSESFTKLSNSISSTSDGDFFESLLVSASRLGKVLVDFIVKPFEIIFNIASVFGPFFKKIFDDIFAVVSTILNKIIDVASFVFGEISKLSSEIKSSIEESGGVFSDIFETKLSDSLSKGLDNLENFATSAKGIGKKVGENFSSGVGETKDLMALSFENIKNQMKEVAKEVKITSKQIASSLMNGVGQGVGTAFAAFGKAIAEGKNALQSFVDSLLATMGQMAIQLGSQFILQGLAYMWAGLPNGPSLVAAGSALAAFGGILSSVGGGGAESAGGGVASNGADGSTTVETVSPVAQEELQDQRSAVTVNVEGTVLDPQSVGTRIAEILSDAGFANGAQIA